MKKTFVEQVRITDKEDEVPPPPPLQSIRNFRTLQDWWVAAYNSQPPQERVSFYEVGVFESKKTRVLYLVGKYKSGNDTKIVFEPPSPYFILPEEYCKLSQEERDKKLISQLGDFTKMDSFSKSYFAEADSILYRGNVVIWSKSQ